MLTNFNKMLKKLDNQDVEHCIDQYYGSYLPLGKLIRNLEQSLLGEKNMTLTQIYIDVVFEDLPDDWKCPRCRQSKDKFNKA